MDYYSYNKFEYDVVYLIRSFEQKYKAKRARWYIDSTWVSNSYISNPNCTVQIVFDKETARTTCMFADYQVTLQSSSVEEMSDFISKQIRKQLFTPSRFSVIVPAVRKSSDVIIRPNRTAGFYSRKAISTIVSGSIEI